MKDTLFTVKTNRVIARDTYEMVLSGDAKDCMRPGSFVNVHMESLYLRRPISVCCADEESLTLVYKVVGKGTEKMKNMICGDQVYCLTDLGNGYYKVVFEVFISNASWQARVGSLPSEVTPLFALMFYANSEKGTDNFAYEEAYKNLGTADNGRDWCASNQNGTPTNLATAHEDGKMYVTVRIEVVQASNNGENVLSAKGWATAEGGTL